MDVLKLKVFVLTADLVDACERRFSKFQEVEVIQTRWEIAAPHDCFVTAGNSFGIMTAGVDAAVVRDLGPDVERAVQTKIMNDYLGEQPVGTAFIVPTGSSRVPLLCHAPTMRVPGSIVGTDNVYLATRAALLTVYHHNRDSDQRIESLGLPAMGAGFGGVQADEVARQMAAAYQLYLEPPYPPDWDRVLRRERVICYAGDECRVRR